MYIQLGMFLIDVIKALDEEKTNYSLVGGYAMALQGVVRATIDIDLVIKLNKTQFIKAEKALNNIGLVSRLPLKASEVFEFRKDYIKKRNLVAWTFVDLNNPGKIVDLILTEDLSKMTTKKVSLKGLKINVASLAEIIKMKKKANRDKDKIDIKLIQEALENE